MIETEKFGIPDFYRTNILERSAMLCAVDSMIEKKYDLSQIEIAIFDFLMYQYAWHMGQMNFKYNYKSGTYMRTFMLSFFNKITSDKSFPEALEMQIKRLYCIVPQKLATYAYYLPLLLRTRNIISEKECDVLIDKYCLKTHVRYEQLQSPKGHTFEGKLIQILVKHVGELQSYYKKNYDHSFEADYVKIFYGRFDVLPIGDDSAYLFK